MDQLPQLEVGDVLLYRNGKSLLTRLIRIFTTSDYNHAGIYVGHGVVYEALADGFNRREYGDMKQHLLNGVDVYRMRKKIDQKAIKRAIIACAGIKYGYVDLLKFLIYILTGKRFNKSSARLICSEAIAKVYRTSGYDLFPSIKNLDYISPSDLANNKKLQKIW